MFVPYFSHLKTKLSIKSFNFQKLNWDEELPVEMKRECGWTEATRERNHPRHYFGGKNRARKGQLDVNCDVSKDACGATAYLRKEDELAQPTISFLGAPKARVAPTSPVSIAQTELLGAVYWS